MDKSIYEDNERKYFLLDYSPSHSEMVIRSVVSPNQNIDLFFKNVQTINLKPKLNGIKIILESSDKNRDNDTYKFKIIDNDTNVGYIDAGLFVEFNNNLNLLQTSLGNFTWTKENIEKSSFPKQ